MIIIMLKIIVAGTSMLTTEDFEMLVIAEGGETLTAIPAHKLKQKFNLLFFIILYWAE